MLTWEEDNEWYWWAVSTWRPDAPHVPLGALWWSIVRGPDGTYRALSLRDCRHVFDVFSERTYATLAEAKAWCESSDAILCGPDGRAARDRILPLLDRPAVALTMQPARSGSDVS